MKRLLLLGLFIPLVAALAACVTSRLYWGYWLRPPSSDPTARVLRDLDSFTSIWWSPQSESGREALASAARDVNYVSGDEPLGRLPADLLSHGLSPIRPDAAPVELLGRVVSALQQARALRTGGGAHAPSDLRGHIAVGHNAAGQMVALVALSGRELSNDHYPYYEGVLRFTDRSGLTLERLTFYYYDVAGLEGIAHWMAAALGLIATTLVWLHFGVVPYIASRSRVRPNRLLTN
ncbi:MAG: hypothetical protein U0X73_08400 [Thermoanaerobaculia bacterium]